MLIESEGSLQLWWNSKQRRQRKTEERLRQLSSLVRTRRTRCSGGTTTATGSCELSGLGVDRNCCQIIGPTWTWDTGAAISAFPLDARIGMELLISDRGGMRVQGTTEYGYGATF